MNTIILHDSDIREPLFDYLEEKLVMCRYGGGFCQRLQSETDIPILDMPAITAKRCAELLPGKTAAILATTGN